MKPLYIALKLCPMPYYLKRKRIPIPHATTRRPVCITDSRSTSRGSLQIIAGSAMIISQLI